MQRVMHLHRKHGEMYSDKIHFYAKFNLRLIIYIAVSIFNENKVGKLMQYIPSHKRDNC